MFEIGDSVWWRGRRCVVRGIGPASLPERTVELEEEGTREWHSVPLIEMQSELVGRVRAFGGKRASEFPQERVTNLGRRITVDRVEGASNRFVFRQGDEKVAELHPARSSTGSDPGEQVGWSLTFPDSPPRILAAPLHEPPIGGSLLFIDIALRNGAEAH